MVAEDEAVQLLDVAVRRVCAIILPRQAVSLFFPDLSHDWITDILHKFLVLFMHPTLPLFNLKPL